MAEQNKIMLLYSVFTRGKSKQIIEMLNSSGIRFHVQMTAFGTAPSEMMDIFGLGSSDKDALISLAPEDTIRRFTADSSKEIGMKSEYGGLMMSLRMSAINRLLSELIIRANEPQNEKGEALMPEENKHSSQLILIMVDQGYTEQVMQTARKAGAMGGTILRARLAGTARLEHFGIKNIQDEKEIITILAPSNTAADIMNEVNHAHGMTEDAHGMVMALPVEKAFKI